MKLAGKYLFGAGLASVLLTACQTSQSGGSPEAEPNDAVDDPAMLDSTADASSGAVDAEFVDPSGAEYPDPADAPESDDEFRVSLRGDDGEWDVIQEGGGRDPLPAWTQPPSAAGSKEIIAPIIGGAPPAPDFLRVSWEENPRKARWTARDTKRYLFFAFLSTGLGNASTRLQQDLFTSQAFHDLARDRMVLTYLDFPRRFGSQADEILRERYYRRFKDHFEIHGFPSAVLLDPEGNVVCRFRGYSKRHSVASMVTEMRDAMGAATPAPEDAAAPLTPE